MSERPGFMMYHDTFHALVELEDASFKRVLCAACQYSETGEISTQLDAVERALFGMLKSKLDADWGRYQRRVEAGRKGGQKSGETRRNAAGQNEAKRSKMNDFEAKRSKTNDCEANEPTITVTPTVTITPTIGNSSNSYARAGREEGIPPSVEEVADYIREHGLGVDAQDFLDRCDAAGWRDGKGEPVTNWKSWLKGYAMRAAMAGRGRQSVDPRLAALETMKGGAG